MSYEYSSAKGRFEIPNPYRVENLARFIGGAVAAAAGILLLVGHREALGHNDAAGIKALAVAILLLAVAMWTCGSALVQLRYYFGRGRPADLRAPNAARTAEALKETLRQNALTYTEPQGPIANLLHHLFDTLIFAPADIRYAAEAQAYNLLLTLAIALGMGLGSLFYPDPAPRSWIAAGLFAALNLKLLREFWQRTNIRHQASAGVGFVLAILALPIVGPPLLARFATSLPDISRYSLVATLWVSLAILAVAQLLFFLTLLRQLRERPSINMACEQRTVTMNGNPAKLFEELERLLQSRWTETIPNRKYAQKKLPEILTGHSGSFDGEVLEETQPLPAGDGNLSFGELLSAGANYLVAALTGLSLLTFIAFVAVAWIVAQAPMGTDSLWSMVCRAAVLFLAYGYCMRSAHLLWGRVDFSSLLLWVEIHGSFEESQMNIGNQMTSTMSSQKKVINVESMTLRVWTADLDSVIFYKDGRRSLVGMRGRPDEAKFYADHLERFAAGLASVVAPSSNADFERIAKIAQVQQLLGTPAAPVAALAAAPVAAIAAVATTPARCPNRECGRETVPGAAFCGFCGTRLQALPEPP